MPDFRKILFVRTDRMGDVLMNLPAIGLLRRTFPKSWITLLSDEPVRDLFQGHPDLDECLSVDMRSLRRSLAVRWVLFRRIRAARFDLAVISNPDKLMHALCFLAGIGDRIGYRRKWGGLLTAGIPDDKSRAARHEIDSNLRLVGLVCQKKWDGAITIPSDPAAERAVQKLLAERAEAGAAVAAVHAGTSNLLKRWPLENFAELCDRVAGQGCRVVLIGGPEERERAGQIARMTKSRPEDWTGRLRLSELVAFLKHPDVKTLVSSDSGPMHIAWMSGKPVVALYAKDVPGSDPVRWGPRDGKSIVIHKPINEIGVNEVFDAVQRITRGSDPSGA